MYKEIKDFGKSLEGKKLYDYCQWEDDKRREIKCYSDNLIKNMKKNYLYKISLEREETHLLEGYFLKLISIITLMITIVISVLIAFFGESYSNVHKLVDFILKENAKKELLIEIQKDMGKSTNQTLIMISIWFIALVVLVVIFEIYKKHKIKKDKASIMYYEEVIRLLDEENEVRKNHLRSVKNVLDM